MDMSLAETESALEGMNIDDEESPFVSERGFYQPSTDDTWEPYLALLCIVEQQMGGFKNSVLCIAAHEVLSVLKCQNIDTPYAKRYEIEKLMNPLPDHTFEQLCEISGQITDFFRNDSFDQQIKHGRDGRDSIFVAEEGFYQPTTEETSQAYKLLLDVIKSQIGESQDMVVLCTIAHEVLHTLKNNEFGELQARKFAVENLINPISDNYFNILLHASELINDFADPRLGGVNGANGVGSSARVEPTLAVSTIRAVDCDQIRVTPSGWSDDDDGRDQMVLDGRRREVCETDQEIVTRRLGQLTTDDPSDGDYQDDDDDDDDDDDGAGEVDGRDDQVDGGDEGSDGFVVIEEGEDWVMVDSGTP